MALKIRIKYNGRYSAPFGISVNIVFLIDSITCNVLATVTIGVLLWPRVRVHKKSSYVLLLLHDVSPGLDSKTFAKTSKLGMTITWNLWFYTWASDACDNSSCHYLHAGLKEPVLYFASVVFSDWGRELYAEKERDVMGQREGEGFKR